MGLFDFLKGKKPAPSSDELRELLFAAIDASDWQRLGKWCDAHHRQIVREFSWWKIVPEGMRRDPPAAQRYIERVGTLADFFARVRGEPQLFQELIGPEDANPMVQWNKKLQHALSLMNEVRYAEVISLMTDLLKEMRRFEGDLMGDYRAKAHGHLGCSYFQTGSPMQAVEPLTQALNLCRQRGDTEGLRIHLANLFEVNRYLGQAGPAADHAAELADRMIKAGNHKHANWWRKQAAIVRAGEPLVRLVAAVDGERWEVDEIVPRVGVAINYEFYRNRMTLAPSLQFQQQAKQTWAEGQAKETIENLLAAIEADRFDPDPFYQMGNVVLYSRMYEQAAGCFQKAEELAPGWFFCRRFRWLAQQLAEGKLDHDTFQTLQALDEDPQTRPPAAKVSLAQEALAKTPQVAWLHLCLGANLNALNQRPEAEAAFRRGLDCAGEPDVRCCLLLELALLQERRSVMRIQLLEEVQALNGSLTATAGAQLALKWDGPAEAR